jgi:uncharacterized protein (TIGR00725 family)
MERALVKRLPIVAVIGSGDARHGNPELAEAVGRLIAGMGFHLLTGGGRGVMADACRGFASVPGRTGLSLGIIPRSGDDDGPKDGYPNPWVEVPILTHLAGRLGPDGEDSRNAINVLTANRIVALPGGEGTRAEVKLALRHGKPILAVVDVDRLGEEIAFLRFLEGLRVPRQEVWREEDGWDLEGVRRFFSLSDAPKTPTSAPQG